jgi:hypothetical protein
MQTNVICQAVLAEAQAAGRDNPLIAELVERVAGELRFAELEEHATALERHFPAGPVYQAFRLHLENAIDCRSGPFSDSELVVRIVAAGPHSAAVNACAGMLAGLAVERGEAEIGLLGE